MWVFLFPCWVFVAYGSVRGFWQIFALSRSGWCSWCRCVMHSTPLGTSSGTRGAIRTRIWERPQGCACFKRKKPAHLQPPFTLPTHCWIIQLTSCDGRAIADPPSLKPFCLSTHLSHSADAGFMANHLLSQQPPYPTPSTSLSKSKLPETQKRFVISLFELASMLWSVSIAFTLHQVTYSDHIR